MVYKKVKDAVGILPSRYQKVVFWRYGIDGEPKTLEEIGDEFEVTRERIRQIEVKALEDLASDAKAKLLPCVDWASQLIKNEGGIVAEHDFLERHGRERKGALHLILYLDKGFLRGAGDDIFHHHWYLDEEVRKRALQEVGNLHAQFTKHGKLLPAQNVMEFLTHPHFLRISKLVALSPLETYGFTYWPEVVPKGVKDRAYIVLTKEGKPLHFMKITARINELGLGKRPALKQTVHNELIKDKRFILVGRGIYGLKKWGFREGTVKDILTSLFKELQKPLSKEEIVSRVLRERLVQKNTILLNLNNGGDFVQLKDGRYTLRNSKSQIPNPKFAQRASAAKAE